MEDSPQQNTPTTQAAQDEEYLTNLFYSHFHPAHPFLLPHGRYKAQHYPTHLRHVVQLAGSHNSPSRSSSDLAAVVENLLAEVTEQSSATVQSLLLFAIVLHARLEMAKATTVLSRAADMAISIGMNKMEFASTHGMQDPLVEESLRRTWWELYVVDGYFAALHRQKSFKCNTVELTAELPSDEALYTDGALLPPSVKLANFDERFFSNDDMDFSSFCYRIAAIRILSRTIATMGCDDTAPDNIQAVDNALGAWKFHLPRDKAEVLNRFGEVDHMILQAHAFISYIHILVHFPRSELLLQLPSATDIACFKRMDHASPISAQHAIKAIAASKDLSDIAALPIRTHSPLFICCLVFACIIQISACSAHGHDCLVQHRERVALMTGVLKQMGRVWPLAQDVLRHINRRASKVFRVKDGVQMGLSQTTPDSGIDVGSVVDSFSWLDQIFAGDFYATEDFPGI